MKENVDPQEIAKFAAHAHQWWDETGDLKTLHQINPLRLGYIKSKSELAGKKIIDIGCGGGILTESLAKEGAIVTGIDMNKPVIGTAKLHQLESGTNVTYFHTSAEQIASEQAEQFDIVCCLEMLEHVPDPLSIVKACATLAKPGGKLFFSTINRNLKAYLFAVIGAEYVLHLLPKNTHDYAKFIRPSELHAWVSAENIKPLETKGISYNPLTQTFTLTDDISVNYLFYAEKSL